MEEKTKLKEADIYEFLQNQNEEECMKTEKFQTLWSVFQDAWEEMAKSTRSGNRNRYEEIFGSTDIEDFGILDQNQLSLEKGLLARFLKKLKEREIITEENSEVEKKVDEFRQKLILTMREDFAQMFLDYYKENPGKKISAG